MMAIFSQDEDMHHPVSPIDFNVSARRRSPPIFRSTVTSSAADTHHNREAGRNFSDHALMMGDISKPSSSSTSGKLAQAVIIQRLNEADELVQATLLEV